MDEVCGLFKLAGMPEDVVKKMVFPLSLKEKALTSYELLDDIGAWNYDRLKLEFHQKFYPMHLVHRDRNYIYIYNFGLAKEKVSLKLGGGLSQCYIHAPIISSQEKFLFKTILH